MDGYRLFCFLYSQLQPALWFLLAVMTMSRSHTHFERHAPASHDPDLQELHSIHYFQQHLQDHTFVSQSAPPSYRSLVSNATGLPPNDCYAYIIVGGRTAGCPIAATLSPKYHVIVLERGGLPNVGHYLDDNPRKGINSEQSPQGIGDPSMPVNIKPNEIAAIVTGDVNSKTRLQVPGIKLSSNNSQQEKYQILLSDSASTQHAMLPTKLNDRVRTRRVRHGSVVQMIEYICCQILNRKIIAVLNMENIPPTDLKMASTIIGNRVLRLLDANELDQAREHIFELPDMFPDSVKPILLQAALLVREHKAWRAEEILVQLADKVAEKSTVVYLTRAHVATAAGHPHIATDSLDKISNIQHKLATVATLVPLKECAGDIDGAAAMLDSALKWWSRAMTEDNMLDITMQETASFKLRSVLEDKDIL